MYVMLCMCQGAQLTKLFQDRALKALRHESELKRTISAALLPQEQRIFRNNKVKKSKLGQ